VTNSLILLYEAVGGAGASSNGGNGQGGGVFNGPANPFGVPHLTLQRSIVAVNQAEGGASTGGSLYLAPGGVASAESTVVMANDAPTSDDDVFGILVEPRADPSRAVGGALTAK
jgi:hypothetical protein